MLPNTVTERKRQQTDPAWHSMERQVCNNGTSPMTSKQETENHRSDRHSCQATAVLDGTERIGEEQKHSTKMPREKETHTFTKAQANMRLDSLLYCK